MRLLFLPLLVHFFMVSSAFAADRCAIVLGGDGPQGAAQKLQLGQVVDLTLPGQPSVKANFVGKLMRLNNVSTDYFFFDPSSLRIYNVLASVIDFSNANGPIDQVNLSATPVSRTVDQLGETCAAFANYNCMRTMFYFGHKGNGSLEKDLANEEDRTRILVKAIEDNYIDGVQQDAIEHLMANYGFTSTPLDTSSGKQLTEQILASVKASRPVLLNFNVGEHMWQTPYTVISLETGQSADRRLWQPSVADEKSAGRHQVVILYEFQALDGKNYLIVLDSNWRTPRLWPVEVLDRVGTSGMEAWSIRDPQSPDIPL